MPSLNLDLDYFENIKTKRLVGLLGRNAEVLPIRLWCACGKHRPETGRLDGYSAQEIESLCQWWGKSGQMIEAMVRVGFLEKDGVSVHDWQEHAGHLAAFKKRARAGAQARWGRYGDPMLQASLTDATSNAPTIPTLQAKQTGSNEPVTDRCGNVENSENTAKPVQEPCEPPAEVVSVKIPETSWAPEVRKLAAGMAMGPPPDGSHDAHVPLPNGQKTEEQQDLESAIYRERLFKIHDDGVLGNLGFWDIALEVVREAAGDLFAKRGYREIAGVTLD